MWHWIVGYYVIQTIVVSVIAILSWLFWDKRYKKRRQHDNLPPGYVRTEEVSIDPVTQEIQRVYEHPETGDRIYVTEKH